MFKCVSFEKQGVVYTGNSVIHVCNVKGNAHKYKQFAKQDVIQFKQTTAESQGSLTVDLGLCSLLCGCAGVSVGQLFLLKS